MVKMFKECGQWDKKLVKELLQKLRECHRDEIDVEEFIALKLLNRNPFEILVGIILSQNTSDRNAIKAYENLKNVLGGEITAENVLTLPLQILVNAIRVAGLAERRARAIISLAEYIRNNADFFKVIESMDVESSRKLLMSLYGVGPKTADVFLLMFYRKPTFPIDTHIMRVLKRLGLASQSMSYEDIRLQVVESLDRDPSALAEFHILLIVHGRRVCRAINPKCSTCCIENMCCKIGVKALHTP